MEENGTAYALKVTHYPPKDKNLSRCRNEIEILKNIDCEYIVRYFDLCIDPTGRVRILMELSELDLKVCFEDKKLLFTQIRPQAGRILKQIAVALEHIHKDKILHRDLKASNIFVKFVMGKVCIKIGDFGLACFEDDVDTSNNGSHLYRAPEQFFKDYGIEVDIYTIGIVLFEALKKDLDLSLETSGRVPRIH